MLPQLNTTLLLLLLVHCGSLARQRVDCASWIHYNRVVWKGQLQTLKWRFAKAAQWGCNRSRIYVQVCSLVVSITYQALRIDLSLPDALVGAKALCPWYHCLVVAATSGFWKEVIACFRFSPHACFSSKSLPAVIWGTCSDPSEVSLSKLRESEALRTEARGIHLW